jgi:hypothetical protein
MSELLKYIILLELVQQIGIVGIFMYHAYKDVELPNTISVHNV